MEKEPDWNAAENLDLEAGEALAVPLINKDRKRISLGKSEKLVFSQDAVGDMELQVVKAIGDSLHMRQEGFQIGSSKFTGITLLEDWEGNFIEGAYYRDGNIIGRLGDAHSSVRPAKEKQSGYNLRWEVIWIATDWFSIATAGGSSTIRFMETVYRPVYVYVDDDVRNTYGNYYDERRGGGGGGGSGGGERKSECPYGPNCSDLPLDYGDNLVDMEVVRPLTDVELREIIFDPSFASDPNAPCIWDKLEENEYFKQITDKFEGVNSEFHINLSIGKTDDPSVNAHTQFRGHTKPMEIMFNQNRMGRSALEVARTILHEVLHAKFYRSLNTNVPMDTDVKFKETFETYTNQYRGTDVQHHNLMADKYVNAMADVLQDIHPLLGYQAFSDYMTPDVYPDGIPRAFYEALVWDGLRLEEVEGWTNKSVAEKASILKHIGNAAIGIKSCHD